MRSWLRIVTVVSAVLVVAGGAALAAIPGPDGVIHSCMLKTVGTIRIIDPSKGQRCNTSLETPLDWNQAGSGLKWRGAWQDGAAYIVSDAVHYQGSAYVATAPSTSVPPPDPTKWSLLAAQGSPGAPGGQGPAGADGASAYEVWLGLGNSGTEQDFIDSLQGAAGDDGVDGTQALADQGCPPGQFVTGFDHSSNPVCGDAGTVARRHIYWTNHASGTIGRADLDGQNANQSFITGASDPHGVAVDAGHIYWTNSATGAIGRADLNGQNANQNFITGASDPHGVAVDSGHIYWTNFDTGSIGRADLNGQNVNQNFITGASGPFGVAVDSGYIYWTNLNNDAIGRAELNGQNADQSFITSGEGLYGLAVDAGHIYWTLVGRIARADLNGQNVNQSIIDPFATDLFGLAVDAFRIYWTDGGSIGRADLNGQNANQSLITGGSGVIGVALDSG